MNELLFAYLEKFAPLPVGLRTRLDALIQRKYYRKNELLSKAGEINDRLHFILRGMVHCYYYDEELSRYVTYYFLMENDIIGFSRSFYRKEVAGESIEAIESCYTLSISFVELEQLKSEFPAFRDVVEQIAREYNNDFFERLKILQKPSVPDRYRALLKHFPGIEKRMPQKIMASYLTTTPENLSRIRKEMHSGGNNDK